MSSPIRPWDLLWKDVDPWSVSFDVTAAREISERLLRGARSNAPDTHADAYWETLEDEVDRELVRAYGFWAAGWRWASSEPGCGGPVQAWCCSTHSMPNAHARGTIVLALLEWRAWLERLANTFRSIDEETKDLAVSVQIERAAARVLTLVVDGTGCSDAWYTTFATALNWYLERLTLAPDSRREVERIVGGRFFSWIEPTAEASAEACIAIGSALGNWHTQPLAVDDALAAWRRTRSRVRWPRETFDARFVAAHDGHVAYIERRDRARGEARAAGMRDALRDLRAAADEHEPLTMNLLARCQRLVLGVADVPQFRNADAYAKHGRERYALSDDTAVSFERCLADANDPADNVLARATRVYLDVCFVHPFDDGNARAARLALDYVLTRAGLALDEAEPLFAIPRWADDENGVYAFMALLRRLIGKRRRDSDGA